MSDLDLTYWLAESQCTQLLPCEWCWMWAELHLKLARTIAAQALHEQVDVMTTPPVLAMPFLNFTEEARWRRDGWERACAFTTWRAETLEARAA